MQPEAAAIVSAAGAAAGVGLVGAGAVRLLARRSAAQAVTVVPIVTVAAVAAGVAVASALMLLEPTQVRIMAWVLSASGAIAIISGVLIGRRVSMLQQQAADERAARERDAAVEERRRDLISWLSHDLRSPLARMRALAEAAEDGLAPADHTTRMVAEVDTLTGIVDDISTLSRLGSASTTMTLVPTDLGDLVSDSVAVHQPLARLRGIHLSGSADGSTQVSAEPAELTRAVNNLLGNALRHTRKAGDVTVRVNNSDGRAHVTVTDQCGGIAPEHLTHLFETGWRGTTARTPGDGGAGLGLTITRSIVQTHNGTVTVANTSDGCAFTVTLPLLPTD
jgi:signal transduction histidine kinase